MTDAKAVSPFDFAFAKVQELAATFKAGEERYLSPDYQEAEARKDFIDKFWIAMGWDVNHDVQKNPYEQEVKVERTVHAAGQRRADYAFYLAPDYRDPRFFVEAKKPAVDVGTKESYFQLLRYGWNSRTPLAVITDFEQLHILDCRNKPDISTALNRAIAKYRYTDYADRGKFAKIYWVFSREAVAGGSIEKRAAELREPRGKGAKRGLYPGGHQSIDESFLKELDEYRLEVAHAFKAKNPRLDSETLTEITQRTLDRLVFMRFLEDKGIELRRHVAYFGSKAAAWEDFIAASRRLDGIYNGIVFKQHAILDAANFRVDEARFAEVCKRLGHADSPYDFNAIPIHILGSIYERFLGKVIVATDKRVHMDDKPEVRKAGGVYYTPEYIVRYIVENTVGKLIEGKAPEKIAEMRFADIACGSGSFLLGVYDLLLTHHGNYYNALGTKERARCVKRGDCVERDGKLYLALRKKREILLNNIYGVDIDAQAVEVCQLSLYLKLLKDETPVTAHQYLLDFEHVAQMKKLLPDLSRNIVCGNSLIGTDILEGQLFAGEEERKLNPMNFEDAFPEVMRRGGFDAIVGNPPYVRQEGLKDTKDYLKKHYESFAGTADLYTYFMERAVSLLRQGGRYAYIVSSSFLRATYAEALRETLKKHAAILRLVDFGGHAIFSDAKDIYVCIPILAKISQPEHIEIAKVASIKPDVVEQEMAKSDYMIPHARFRREVWSLKNAAETALFEKIMAAGKSLGAYIGGKMYRGVLTGLNDAFIINSIQRKKLLTGAVKGAEFIKPCRGGEDCRDYFIESRDTYMIVIPCGTTRAGTVSKEATVSEAKAWQWFKAAYPRLASYLEPFSKSLRMRQDKGEFWWELRPCDYYSIFEQPKIVFPDICKHPRFCYDDSGLYLTNTAYALATGDKYLLGVLNSQLFWFAISNISIPFGVRAGEFRYRLIYQYMEKVPIRIPDLSIAADQAHHNEVVQKVEAMLEAKKELSKAKTDKDKTYYENKCASLDRQIDRLVYDLYGLTDKEIAIVERTG